MSNYDAATYGDAIADVYDDLFRDVLGDSEAAADLLSEVANHGRALELGIGTGRIALPLAARGADVWGLDSSERMVDQIRMKPGGGDLSVVIGDFADVDVPARFNLIYVAFNTFFLLHRVTDQIRCFRNVAGRLKPGGAFVIEAMVSDETLYDRGQRVHAHDVQDGRVWLEASRYDRSTQRVVSQQILITEKKIALFPAQLRFTSTTELDLMAELAGLELADRFSGWGKEPFTKHSAAHVSLYRKPLG